MFTKFSLNKGRYRGWKISFKIFGYYISFERIVGFEKGKHVQDNKLCYGKGWEK